jgi:aminoglycoside phosphotransferase (APT) family kinase protein
VAGAFTLTTDTQNAALLAPTLCRWIEQQLGGVISDVERIAGGASRLSYFVRIRKDGGETSVVLRMEGGQGPMSGTFYTLAREAELLRALAGSAVRVPRLLGFNAEFQAMLMSRAAGSSDYGRLPDAESKRVVEAGLIDQLAQLHALAIDMRGICQGPAAATIGAAINLEIDYWRALYHQRMPVPEPMIDFAFDWLSRHIPAASRPPVLVHGDIGPGNFLFEDGAITALIDWEIAHPGHPLEDLGALIARTLGTPFGDMRAHIARYAERSGRAVEPAELTYCVILALTRFCVGIGVALAHAGSATDVPMLLRFRQVNLYALGQLLARQEGLEIPAPAPLPAPPLNEKNALFAHAITALDELLLPGLGEPFLQYRARGLGALLHYLQALGSPEADLWQRQWLTQLAALLEQPVDAADDGLLRFRARLADADTTWRRAALVWLLTRASQCHALMRDALGDMYTRKLDYEVPAP